MNFDILSVMHHGDAIVERVYLDAGRWNCDKHGFDAATRKAQGR
jgi:hypothetical protein